MTAKMQQPLLDRLMAKQQSARYASADELLADLGPIAAVPEQTSNSVTPVTERRGGH